ncbi:copper chaperone PCu(A)C [bacterium]|nr:copper chaperone PCu(A)C [bacterium]
MTKHFLAVALAVLLSTHVAHAQMMVSDLSLKHGIGARPGVVHGKLNNHGAQEVSLTAVSSPSFGRIELHTHAKVDGVMRMRQVSELLVAAGATLEMKPGGYHLMLFEPKISDKKAPVSLLFTFNNGQTISQSVTPHAHAMGHKMMHHKGH